MSQQSSSTHYDSDYFEWQQDIGEFGGWANLPRFEKWINASDDVLDFGCGGGYLLKRINCAKRYGVEVNPSAANVAQQNGLTVFQSSTDVPTNSIDIVISNNALEHTQNPLLELKELNRCLRPGGTMVIVVPCENISYRYQPNDINYHLYSWSPMALGNLLSEAGFSVSESKAHIHKWPPGHRVIARIGGRLLFDLTCRLYGRIARRWFQVRAVCTK